MYELLKEICKKQHTSITKTLAKTGLSTSLGSAWKNGREPKFDQLVKFAEALEIPPQEFFTMLLMNSSDRLENFKEGVQIVSYSEDGSVAKYDANERLKTLITEGARDEDEAEILNMFRSLSRKDKHRFMAMVYDFEEIDND